MTLNSTTLLLKYLEVENLSVVEIATDLNVGSILVRGSTEWFASVLPCMNMDFGEVSRGG